MKYDPTEEPVDNVMGAALAEIHKRPGLLRTNAKDFFLHDHRAVSTLGIGKWAVLAISETNTQAIIPDRCRGTQDVVDAFMQLSQIPRDDSEPGTLFVAVSADDVGHPKARVRGIVRPLGEYKPGDPAHNQSVAETVENFIMERAPVEYQPDGYDILGHPVDYPVFDDYWEERAILDAVQELEQWFGAMAYGNRIGLETLTGVDVPSKTHGSVHDCENEQGGLVDAASGTTYSSESVGELADAYRAFLKDVLSHPYGEDAIDGICEQDAPLANDGRVFSPIDIITTLPDDGSPIAVQMSIIDPVALRLSKKKGASMEVGQPMP